MTHKVRERYGKGNKVGGLQRDTLSRRHLTLRVLLLLRPTVPHAECFAEGKTAYGQKKERGGFLFTPSLTFSCPLYRCPLRMTSFSARPSLFQRVSVLLLPLTFLIPPCLSPPLPSCLPLSLPLPL